MSDHSSRLWYEGTRRWTGHARRVARRLTATRTLPSSHEVFRQSRACHEARLRVVYSHVTVSPTRQVVPLITSYVVPSTARIVAIPRGSNVMIVATTRGHRE